MAAGGDFIKTSTGKIQLAATPAVTLVMLETIRDHFYATGPQVGMKPAGGVRTAKSALHNLVMVKETLGDGWLTNEWFRSARAPSQRLLMQLEKERTGNYQGGRRLRRTEPNAAGRKAQPRLRGGRRAGMSQPVTSVQRRRDDYIRDLDGPSTPASPPTAPKPS